MKGIVFVGDREVEVRELSKPSPGAGEVLLAMKASGLCGSDLRAYRVPRAQRGDPTALAVGGHEPCGVVAEVGPGVSTVRVGDRVMLYCTQFHLPSYGVDNLRRMRRRQGQQECALHIQRCAGRVGRVRAEANNDARAIVTTASSKSLLQIPSPAHPAQGDNRRAFAGGSGPAPGLGARSHLRSTRAVALTARYSSAGLRHTPAIVHTRPLAKTPLWAWPRLYGGA
jgi:hypothetical protein